MVARAILGPQRAAPAVAASLVRMGLGNGPVCAITAGWQEREGELDDLEEHLARRTTDLELYRRAEAVFRDDTELHEAYRERQLMLIEMQRLYRRRLDHAMTAARELSDEPVDSAALDYERRSALRAIRTLDREHLRRIRLVQEHFERGWAPQSRAAVMAHREEILAILAESGAVLVAGGHVEVLLNRLRFFGLRELLLDQAIVAWSAGAMALTERVVLFHDHPPQGAGNAEIADAGLGLFPGIVALPHAAERLRLGDPKRVALFARRFAPARCMTLDTGAQIIWRDGRLETIEASQQLLRRGQPGRAKIR